MVLTGGNHGTVTNVTRYNRTGLVDHLPNLLQGRSSHGCSSFLSDGAKVSVVPEEKCQIESRFSGFGFSSR